MTTPSSDIDYDPLTKQRELVRQDHVPGDFDPADYVTERLWAEAVRRRLLPEDSVASLLLPEETEAESGGGGGAAP